MLRPRISRSRSIQSLDGIWDFGLVSAPTDDSWTREGIQNPRPMPVPASYNDITVDPGVHDHVGPVRYQRQVPSPRILPDERLVLFFGSATHEAIVWVNGIEIVRHTGGYLPFEADITEIANDSDALLISVEVDNRLSWQTIPPGYLRETATGATVQTYFHDFYNYAGIHRSVLLLTRPAVAVNDVLITTKTDGTTGIVSYEVEAPGASTVSVRILDPSGIEVGTASGSVGTIEIPNVALWEPGRGRMHTLEIQADSDVYPQPFGIRTVEIRDSQFLINGSPFYFRGYGRHEDNLIRGKGHDDVLMVHDFELMEWQGANSFRTSHYPYDEAVLDYADQRGFVVIDEAAAVGLNTGISGGIFGEGDPVPTYSPGTIDERTRSIHEAHIRELIARDKNHPSVVLWSIANEPDTFSEESRAYFEPLVEATRKADPTRPVGYVNVQLSPPDKEQIIDLFDLVMLNRYYGWYWNNGDLASAELELRSEIEAWLELTSGKPILFTEYGGDALPGFTDLYRRPWSEEYQSDVLAMFHRVFDDYPQIIGEQMWNFADFQTTPGIMRVGGNKKGMFTRERRPKNAARTVRERWLRLRNKQGR